MKNNNEKFNLEEGRKNPFKVPEGYFEGLSDNILSQLPELPEEEAPKVTIIQKLKPILYLAAMIAGLAFLMNILIGKDPENSEKQVFESGQMQNLSASEEEEFYEFVIGDYEKRGYEYSSLMSSAFD